MGAHQAVHGYRSHSHVHIPAELLEHSLKVGAGTKGKSLSHLHVTEEMVHAKNNGVSLSHVAPLDNKMRFIHNSPLELVAQDHAPPSATVVTVESVVYVTASTPKGQPSQTQSSNGNNNSSNGDPRSQYASAKSAAQRSRTFTPSASQTPTASGTSRSVAQSPVETSSAVSKQASAATTALVGGGLTSSVALSSSANNFISSTPHVAEPTIVNNGSSNSSSGLSGGGKAGLAIGVLIAVAIAAGLVLFCLRRRKNAIKEDSEVNNEKHGSFFGSNQQAPPEFNGAATNDAARSASTAPRLSLRPVTQFLAMPNMMVGSKSADGAMSEKPKSAWERQQINPFDDNAVLSEKQPRPESPPTNPFDEGDGRKSPSQTSTASSGAQQPGGDAMAAGGPAPGPRGPNNVHRVQLDFKPTMDDELELKSGQLVRMLHEYDDGWALCIRMDRSQQGVCPRTCLSKLAVKPRPQGPPPNGPNGRVSPNGPNGRMSPNGRPMPPPNGSPRGPGASNMMPRPLSPNTQQRERAGTVTTPSPPSQTGSPRARSLSVAESTGVPVRKPVPGQAL